LRYLTKTREETQRLGQALARALRAGDVLLLSGELGAGKSELARGIARGLGVEGPVPSPTFTLLNIYEEGRVALHHFDWYRADDPEEISAAGLEEYIQGEWISLIEWHERAPYLCPERHLLVEIRALDGDTRQITLSPQGGFRDLELREGDI
jgi:tRNA threonylcarbamoyladenosine biosynthesis protein TsaE